MTATAHWDASRGGLDEDVYILEAARVQDQWSRSVKGWRLACGACDWQVRRTGKAAVRDEFRRHLARALIVDAWNLDFPAGTQVRYWTGAREGDGRVSRTITPAVLKDDEHPWIWLHGVSGALDLTHVDPVTEQPREHVPPPWPQLEAATQ